MRLTSHEKRECISLSWMAELFTFQVVLNAELNPICHLLALLGGATIVVVSRLRVTSGKIPDPCRFRMHLCKAVTLVCDLVT